MLVAARTAPQNSYRNPVEHVMGDAPRDVRGE